jgi:hypothetical protein
MGCSTMDKADAYCSTVHTDLLACTDWPRPLFPVANHRRVKLLWVWFIRYFGSDHTLTTLTHLHSIRRETYWLLAQASTLVLSKLLILPASSSRTFTLSRAHFSLEFHRLFESILIRRVTSCFSTLNHNCRLNPSPPPFRLQFILLNQFATRLSSLSPQTPDLS